MRYIEIDSNGIFISIAARAAIGIKVPKTSMLTGMDYFFATKLYVYASNILGGVHL